MAKSNDFKKPVNNKEVIIDEEEEKNKKLIIIVCLSIVIVLGLIIASITYFNGRDVEQDEKKNNKPNDNKPTEIIKPVEENPVIEEVPNTTTPTVTTPVVVKPKDNVAVTPEDPKNEETSAITSVDENDYMVEMIGNTAKVSGVSRYVAISEDGNVVNNIVKLKVVLDSKYSRDELKNLTVTTTTNGKTNNAFDYIIINGETADPITGVIKEELYFYWVQPIGNGYEKPTSFTVNYGDGNIKTYEIDLSNLNVETKVSTAEEDMFVIPTNDTVFTGTYPYEVEIFRQLKAEEIVWKDTPTSIALDESVTDENLASLEEEITNASSLASETIDNSDAGSNADSTNDPSDTTTIEPDYKEDLNYTIKFNMKDTTNDESGTQTSTWNGYLVVKVYAPIINGTVLVDPSKVVITGLKPDENGKTSEVIKDDVVGNYYTYLYYDTTGDETLNNQKFTIDWDAEEENYGEYTYEFDLSDLRNKRETTTVTEPEQETKLDESEEEKKSIAKEAEKPNELNETDTPAQEVQGEEITEGTLDQTTDVDSETGTLD